MKKIIILTIASLSLCSAGVFASSPRDITASSPVVEQRNDSVYVDFDLHAGRRAARSGHTLVYRPYLADGEYRWDLPEVVIQRSRARISEQRHEWASGEGTDYEGVTILRGGESMHYSASVPRQGWMAGANLEVEIIDAGCCNVELSLVGMIAAHIELPTPVAVVPVWVPDPDYVAPIPTTGDLIAEERPFVLHASQFNSSMPELMFDDDREGALKVHFAVGKYDLEPGRADNAKTLGELLDSIKELQSAPDSHVAHVVVAGFASPEGSFRLNDRLAWNRASELRSYIASHSGLDSEIIHIYNGVEDWYGLRMLVEKSNLPNKQAIIDIIDNVPIWDAERNTGREQEIKKLDGSRTYSYMLRNFFPELRAAAYIKVYYDNDSND